MRNLKKVWALTICFVTVMSLCLTSIAAGQKTGYPDVPADAPYAEAVVWCREHNLMAGDDKVFFDPDGTLDRRTMATATLGWATLSWLARLLAPR